MKRIKSSKRLLKNTNITKENIKVDQTQPTYTTYLLKKL